jgi:hypothetical protein
MRKNYRLVWFQHLHKVAGSSIVRLAMANHEVLFPQHRNGNPLTGDDKLIRIWEMDPPELIKFVNRCEHEGITFVATEWGAPDLTLLASDPRITLITCLRDPLQRYMSEFYYALYRGRTSHRSPEDFVNTKKAHSLLTQSMFNYYCRIFSRYNDNPDPVGQEQHELASSALSLFDSCSILEEKDAFSGIRQLLGWLDIAPHANRTELDFLTISRLLVEGRIHQLMRYLVYPRREPSDDFRCQFLEQNHWDYQLYDHAKMLSGSSSA